MRGPLVWTTFPSILALFSLLFTLLGKILKTMKGVIPPDLNYEQGSVFSIFLRCVLKAVAQSPSAVLTRPEA